MILHGQPPYLECSVKGDVRFSPLYAYVKGWDGRSIEQIYQGSKILADGTVDHPWWRAVGQPYLNHQDCAFIFSMLWDMYIDENPQLLVVLKEASGLSDRYGQPDRHCQTTELWRIRGERG